jgi:3-oxocholest-4-en-26-oyl-CoA dehydrogenase alpha subunit
VRLALTPEQEQFQLEARTYFDRLMTREVREELARGELEGPTYRELVKQLGTDGWLTVAWPEEYGGRGLSAVESFIFFDETHARGRADPLPDHQHGRSDAHALRHRGAASALPPRHRRGGHPLLHRLLRAGCRHRPRLAPDPGGRDGDHYVINGQKMWTSLIHHADYVWLACRTDPDAKKHKGISMIIVPTDAEGFSWTPVNTLGGGFTSATYYEDVRVGVENLVGEENGGWQLITTQLNEERVALSSSGWSSASSTRSASGPSRRSCPTAGA